jgi:hypothetical protein
MLQEQKDAEQTNLAETGDRRVHRTSEQIRKLRIAETVVSTAIHPDTKEMLPWG